MKTWQPMNVKRVGTVKEVVLVGGGKLSTTGGDPGEPRKPRGIEPR